MSVLTACSDAAVELVGRELTTLFSTTDQFALELRLQANKAARAIQKAHDWRALTTLGSVTGDGTATTYALPADYDRMPLKADMFYGATGGRLTRSRDLDQWLDANLRGQTELIASWTMLGGLIQINPALANLDPVKFYYQSKYTVLGGDPVAAKEKFSLDADTFRLSESLLTLDVIWRWRAMKRLEYAEDMQNFEIAMSQDIAKDKGSRILTVGRQRLPLGTDVPFPVVIGGGSGEDIDYIETE